MIEREDETVGAAGAGGREPEPIPQQAPPASESPGAAEAGGPPAPAAPTAVNYNDRILCLAQTGGGKSTFLNHLFGMFTCQRLLVDTKDEWAIDGVTPARDVAELDWSQPILHYIADEGTKDEFDRLFRLCNARRGRHLVVAAHELADLCLDQPNNTPQQIRKYLRTGRAHGLGLLGASQRPVLMPTGARTEAQHVFIFVRALFDADDQAAVAKMCGMAPDQLAAAMNDVHARLGEYGFLWWNKVTRELVECPPLPEGVRNATARLVRKTTVA